MLRLSVHTAMPVLVPDWLGKAEPAVVGVSLEMASVAEVNFAKHK